MCVKLPFENLNPSPCIPHPTSTYICGETIAPKVCGSTSSYAISNHIMHLS